MGNITPLLEVENFSVSFSQYKSRFQKEKIQVVKDFTLTVNANEIVAVVGSSGSGKSLLAHGILGILPNNATTSGKIKYKGQELTQKDKEKLRGREIALIPQSVNYLDPLQTVGKQIASPLQKDKADIQGILNRFQLSNDIENKYPFQLSGGMARRVLIATSLTSGANLIIADEPTPGLHASVVEETLNTLRDLADSGCGILMITHDIDLAFQIANKIAVFYDGRTLEVADAKEFQFHPEKLKHPYSKALWHALPQNGFKCTTSEFEDDLIADRFNGQSMGDL
ncbi:MAG: ABC transporter ATP-binding protein [Niallia sp.]